jgi:hypothetical protein
VYDSRLDKASRLKSLLPLAPPGSLRQLPQGLFLFDDALLSVVYAPLDHVNTGARIVLAGLTPTWRQAQAAYKAHVELKELDDEQAGFEVKRRSALSGGVRGNLIAMLDELGIHRHLGLDSTTALFGSHAQALHSTCVLRYPVFKAGKGYSGQNPRPSGHPFLRAMLERLCAPELLLVPDALIVPMGKAAEEGLEHLTQLGLLSRQRWLRGFPHPSAPNGRRKAEFARARAELDWQVHAWFSRGSLPPPRWNADWQASDAGNAQLAASL